MAEFKLGEEKKYETTNNTERTQYFTLKDDGDKKDVRFMYKDSNDVKGYTVHEVILQGRTGPYKKYVDCLRGYDSPLDDCPLCKANYKRISKMYIPLYDLSTNQVCVWERSTDYFSRMSNICAKYPNVVGTTFEITRYGQAGSRKVAYEIIPVAEDNTTLADLPEVPQVLGKTILQKSASDMNEYLATGKFPYNNNYNRVPQPQAANPIPQRRTPVNTEVF